MRRIGIFVFYDGKGTVDEYKIYLLKSLQPFLSDLIIVVNGFIENAGLEKLYEYTEYIYIRENRGNDCGAYKEVLINKYKEIEWLQYDEIILFNDTFYGPIIPWENIFNEMSSEKLDFWGLSRKKGGTMIDGTVIANHIQSFFLVIGRSMFCTPQWIRFWEELEYPNSYWDTVKNFEIRFTQFFAVCGFRFSSWLDQNGGGQYMEDGMDSPYIAFAYDIVAQCSFPVVKYRALSLTNYRNASLLLNYIRKDTDYDEKLISRHLERMEKENRLKPFGIAQLEDFVATHQKIYIFGHGQYGRGLADYFEARGWRMSGFVVSNPENEEEIGLENAHIERSDGIVVALAEKFVREVRTKLEERFEAKNLLFPRL